MRPGAYDYDTHSRIAGPLTDPHPTAYRVRYRSLLAREPRRIRAVLLMGLAPVLSALLLAYLVWPSHWTVREGGEPWLVHLDTVMLVSIGLICLFMLVNVTSIAHATLVATDPVPVHPEPGSRVAFLTTYVPGKEPLTMVRGTLEGATRLRHEGHLDVWLLDEGDSAEAKALCAELGVRHFTRAGVPEWNRAKGPHKARTKHGNYNAWLALHGDSYDYFASVDTDHVPHPDFLVRTLGYFRDPDIAFVVGPQVYGNYTGLVTKAAESQQFLFHALIQRAGNRYHAPMFVGTNNVVRVRALKGIGGLYDSITEDMATGFELHRTKNPRTGHFWRSVYTPDVLAVGEGPASWTDFFTQQLRWSRGTYETLFKQYWKAPFRTPPGRLLNYTLMLVYYPMTAVNWLLGVLSCVLHLWFGASGTQVSTSVWLMIYSDAVALQIGLYLWNRRHNVSPHEPEGSGGLAGMAMSALCAPVYLRSLGSAVLRTRGRFVVTPKGGEASPDRLLTFRIHLFWAAVLLASLVASFVLGHTHAAMRTWAVLALAVSLAPVTLWALAVRGDRRVPRFGPGVRLRVPARVRIPVRVRARTRGAVDTREGIEVRTATAPAPSTPAPTTTGGN
ncbi:MULTISPECIES: glycosyltransferase family 2 protein [unclassified Streptomyces]|uniref:glycosyltransferase family 2 protein n=1 Tax=unclassified Streptomyces TaxID=2593676 RepID=UPI0016608966|nr:MULTISPECIES: cellulose synthase catalytic subunit [unclassified Streptomyces]MBD0710710.1 glycosyl transferase [Streptomyces sp. CBMA291]MBD0715557.1 glycosyl transferase [Streptomyces sp. CBMA370]